jgi:biotin transport system substrate-specific component
MASDSSVKSGRTIHNMVKCGLFAALTAVLTLITIPLPSGVPITLQTFSIALCGFSLGIKYGTLSTGVYIAIGALGLPVFSGARGGFSMLTGVTGGFIFGFLPLTMLCGLGVWLAKASSSKRIQTVIAISLGSIGIVICHVIGTAQFAFLTGRGFLEAAVVVSVPYLVKDFASVALAYLIAIRIRKIRI